MADISPADQIPIIETKQFWTSLIAQVAGLDSALTQGGFRLEGWLRFLVNNVPVRVQYLDNNDALIQIGTMDDIEETWRYEVRIPKVWVTS